MTRRVRTFVILLGAAAAIGLPRHALGAMGRKVPGGIVIRHAGLYDAVGHSVLKVGCGPGRLSLLLAREHGLDVTGPGARTRDLHGLAPLPLIDGARRGGRCLRSAGPTRRRTAGACTSPNLTCLSPP